MVNVVTQRHMAALMRPQGVALVGATDRPNSVGGGILHNLVVGNWLERDGLHRSCSMERVPAGGHTTSAFGRSPDHPELPYLLFPVNPKRKELMGFACYDKVSSIGGEQDQGAPLPDLAVVCVPAVHCAEVLRDCGRLGSLRAVIIIAAGFKEVGEAGASLERECVKIAEEYDMAITGPNCLGVQNPNFKLNASFSGACANPGHVAFISQSGAICTAILDWSLQRSVRTSRVSNLGFSAFVSLGSMSHVEWSHWIHYCGEDPDTAAVMIYMESVGDADQFINAAQKVTKHKPIIVIKAGKSQEASAAAISHTGSLTGTYQNFEAAMKRAGVLVVDTIDDFQNLISLISTMAFAARNTTTTTTTFNTTCSTKSLLPRVSENVVIITNAGGPGVLCTDAVAGSGLKMVNPLPAKLVEKLNKVLPAAWSHANPIDVLGDADDVAYAKTLDAALEVFDEEQKLGATTDEVTLKINEGVTILVLLSPQSVTKPQETAEHVARALKTRQAKASSDQAAQVEPFVICSWMGGEAVKSGKEYLLDQLIPVFDQPDVAARTVGLFCRQRRLAACAEPRMAVTKNERAHALLKTLKAASAAQTNDAAGSTASFTLSEHDSKSVLRLYDIACTKSSLAQSAEEAVEKAEHEIGGYPVVMKIHGGRFTHKSDIGGVKLDLQDAAAVKAAFAAVKQSYEQLDPTGFEGVTVQPMITAKKSATPNNHPAKDSCSPELIIGCVIDPQFGPMVMFGTGGTYVEIFNDTATTLAPVNNAEAAQIVDLTHISRAIVAPDNDQKKRARYASCDPQEIYSMISKFSHLCYDLKEYIQECELNPVVVTTDQKLIALDARIVIKK